ncbi:ROK family protein [Actinoallomurus bryophytorum]|uniref:Polyphosphate glucokinase n=1 Tax=Actinoallomurus bryophytorum TaxID=1490222 RepID=A0A543CCK5_9ACTN|nr:ROK family protein [Actinoallomurus bryophytorum]TQL94823.1 polyphosphate glucokinase [Actinoallomurus bryophytorum]
MEILGIDIGGSGIKGAPVEVQTGEFTRDRLKVDTPAPAEPREVAKAVAGIVRHFDWDGPVGVTFPGVVIDGVTHSAANLSDEWRGLQARDLFAKESGVPITLLNDADAAGVAEMTHGAGRGRQDTVLLVTLGTGIGTALFTEGRLVPNTELGHIEIRGKDAEERASAHAREVHEWSWSKWAEKLDEYLHRIEDLVWPSLIIVGGGVSRHAEHFLPHLKDVRATVVPAELHNAAGIVGAAMAAAPRTQTG